MRYILILITILLIIKSCKKDLDLVKCKCKPTDFILNDSFAYYKDCQLIIHRSYISKIGGVDFQIAHTKEIIGEPCNEKTKIHN